MKKWISYLVVATSLLITSQVVLAEAQDAVKKKIETTLGLGVSAIADAPIPGMLQLVTNRGLFYATADGKYFMQGRIYNLDEDMRNETEVAISGMRLDGVAEFSDSVIEFKAKNEKYVVTVFTDITCGYCRKLHNEMGDYNDLGITVRYLAFPRGGLNGKTYEDMVSVWCAEDQQEAMDVAKGGGNLSTAKCSNMVANQYNFGQKIGVSGTPNIIMPDGSLIGGYQPAKQLIETLKQI